MAVLPNKNFRSFYAYSLKNTGKTFDGSGAGKASGSFGKSVL